ncbi:MAG: hypothetical protein ACTSXC_07745, partial [Candidatus Freyarchaeota archaeon]
ARLLGLKPSRVYACLKALERRGLVDSFPYYIEYYGWKRVHLQPTRIYRLTEAGRQSVGNVEAVHSSVKALPGLSIRLDKFRRWGLEGAYVGAIAKHYWSRFKALRKSRGRKG